MKCDWHSELDRFCEMSDKRERDDGSSPSEGDESEDGERSTKKPRTSEDFYSFCTHILDYENYEEMKKEEEEYLGNSTLGKESAMKPSHNNSGESNSLVEITSDDSYDLITCFCQKPFAGRPMIECNACFTWIHLRCAKVKKSEIPDIFICPSCKKQPH